MTHGPDTDHAQPELLPGLVRAEVKAAKTRASKAKAPVAAAEVDPVARVLVDIPLAHLDRTFDYLVPATMSEAAVPGARVKVRFAGQESDGFVVARLPESDHPGALAPLRRVVSPEPVLTPAVRDLVGRVAERYAGIRADVLRLAVPPRHATTEQEVVEPPPAATADATLLEAGRTGWARYASGFLPALTSGQAPRAVWNAAPGENWPSLLATAAADLLATGQGTLVCLPDGKDVARLDTALAALLGRDQHAVLLADRGPAQRYRDFLSVSRGQRKIVIGTRAAAFAPVADLGLVVIWDDGDDLHAEPRAPYPHTREVLLTRAEAEGTAALVAGFARTAEAEVLLRTGWARALEPAREHVRAAVTVAISGATDRELERDPFARSARIPAQARDLVRQALESGPVLVQTPRSGYAASLACERCRTPARCRACTGPLRLAGPTDPPCCAWCGTAEPAWACPVCEHRGLRAPVMGETRTAEELGRAFPKIPVVSSGGDQVRASVPGRPGIVVATPGAEPVAEGGYAAVLLLDTWLALGRPDLRVREEALRRWFNAAGLIRSGGRVLAVGDPADPGLQALVRWDPAGAAERELADRASAHLPPACRLATVTGDPGAVDDALTLLAVPEEAEVLGPVEIPAPSGGPAQSRLVVRVPRAAGPALAAACGELQRIRSARKLDPVRIQLDPLDL